MASFMYEKTKSIERNANTDRLQTQKNINERLGGMSLEVISQANFDALTTKDPEILYFVENNGHYTLFKGDIQISGEGGEITVDYGLYLKDYTYAPNTSTVGQLSREGTAYASGHTQLERPPLANTTYIYDGGVPSRFVPRRGYNRYLILRTDTVGDLVAPYGRCTDGNSVLEFDILRNGVTEHLKYTIRLTRFEIIPSIIGSSRAIVASAAYGLLCEKTVDGLASAWEFDAFNGYYTGEDADYPNLTTHLRGAPGYSVSGMVERSCRTAFPVLTLGFLKSDLSIPYLVVENGSETGRNLTSTEYEILEAPGESLVLTESEGTNKQLGILYDPDTGEEYEHKPSLVNPPTGKYLTAAKIAGYSIEEDVDDE